MPYSMRVSRHRSQPATSFPHLIRRLVPHMSTVGLTTAGPGSVAQPGCDELRHASRRGGMQAHAASVNHSSVWT